MVIFLVLNKYNVNKILFKHCGYFDTVGKVKEDKMELDSAYLTKMRHRKLIIRKDIIKLKMVKYI